MVVGVGFMLINEHLQLRVWLGRTRTVLARLLTRECPRGRILRPTTLWQAIYGVWNPQDPGVFFHMPLSPCGLCQMHRQRCYLLLAGLEPQPRPKRAQPAPVVPANAEGQVLVHLDRRQRLQ